MLPSPLILIYLSSLRFSLARSSTLYASHYGGTVSALELTETQTDTSGSTYNLKVTSNTTACGSQPGWLTLHDETKTLYCSDESSPGTISAFNITANGSLESSAKVQTISGGVHNAVYYAAGKSYIAIPHYSNMSVSTFQLPLSDSSQQLQALNFSASSAALVDGKPIQPRPHQIVVDPTHGFIIVPDLGANKIRILAIDQTTGSLSECSAYDLEGGPRHAVFKPVGLASTPKGSSYSVNNKGSPLSPRSPHVAHHRALSGLRLRRSAVHKRHDTPLLPRLALVTSDGAPQSGLQTASSPLPSAATPTVVPIPTASGTMNTPDYVLYVTTETVSAVTSFHVSYANSTCPTLHMLESQCGYPNCFKPNAFAKAAEIRVKDDFLYVSNRNDTHYAPGFDSITTWDFRVNDTLTDPRLANAQGKWPRTFEINKEGNLVAVGNQVNGTVVILQRNTTTGDIGNQVASVSVGLAGNFSYSDGVSGGVSSVVWKEDDYC